MFYSIDPWQTDQWLFFIMSWWTLLETPVGRSLNSCKLLENSWCCDAIGYGWAVTAWLILTSDMAEQMCHRFFVVYSSEKNWKIYKICLLQNLYLLSANKYFFSPFWRYIYYFAIDQNNEPDGFSNEYRDVNSLYLLGDQLLVVQGDSVGHYHLIYVRILRQKWGIKW